MKCDRTCSASGVFVANNVMSFNEIWRKSLYNFKQCVKKVTILLLTTYTILPEPPQQSGRTLIVYCVNMLL